MHFFDVPNNMYGGHGIVGAQTPLGAGLAFATMYEDEVINKRANSRVTLCFLGDGALNQGAFHEAANLAKAGIGQDSELTHHNQFAVILDGNVTDRFISAGTYCESGI